SSSASFAAGNEKAKETIQNTKIESKQGTGGGTGGGLSIPLEVTNTNPVNNAVNVPVDTDIKFTFTKNVINDSVKENNKKLFSMKKADGDNVEINVLMADTEDG